MDFDRNVKILGTGRYIPERKIDASDLDRIMGLLEGTVLAATGVQTRYWITAETSASMAREACYAALDVANLTPKDVDLIISANGVNQQPIPTGASLLSEQIGLQNDFTPAFDVNASCMSFYQALDVASSLIESGKYENALLCSSEVTSTGINFNDLKSAPLFGDGAVAMVIGKDNSKKSGIYFSHMETYSRGAHFSEIRGGGNNLPASEYTPECHNDFVYELHGTKMGRVVFENIQGFFQRALNKKDISLTKLVDDVKAIIPHQVSPSFVKLLGRRMNFPKEKLLDLTTSYGNMLAASVPLGIDEVIKTGKLQRGDRLLIAGGGSGISLGMMYLKY